MSKAI